MSTRTAQINNRLVTAIEARIQIAPVGMDVVTMF
jgi:hypothetical protein